MILETERSEVSKLRRAEGVVPNRLRKCGLYIYRYVGGTIVGLSYNRFKIVTVLKQVMRPWPVEKD